MLAEHLWGAYGSFAIVKMLLYDIVSTFFSLDPVIIILFRFYQTRWMEDRLVAGCALEIWASVLKVIKYWKGLCKSSRPSIKSFCEVVVDHYTSYFHVDCSSSHLLLVFLNHIFKSSKPTPLCSHL